MSKSRFFSTMLLAVSASLGGFTSALAAEDLVPVNAPEPILNIQHWLTDNGAHVYFVETHEIPIIDMRIVFDAGSARDDQTFGVANFTSAMLEEGTTALNADQIAEAFDNVGAAFSASVSRDSASVSLRTLAQPEFAKPALTTFSQVMQTPNFPADSFARVRTQILNAIEDQEQTPGAIANRAFYASMYGNYPYGHSPLGTRESIQQLSAQDLQNFYQKYYVGKNATVALVGDMTREQAEKIANQVVGQLPAGTAPMPLAQPVYDPKKLATHIDFPASQTYVRMGEFGIARDNPAYFPLTVGNYILGGGMLVSRLFKEVRDKEGLTYNIGSYFVPMKATGPFVISLQTRNETAGQAIQLSKDILNQFVHNGVSDEELKNAKQNLIQGYYNRFASNNSIADNLAVLGFYGLPLNYFDTYQSNIAKVTSNDIHQAFRQHITPDSLLTITVGPALNTSDDHAEQDITEGETLSLSDATPVPVYL